MILYNLTEVTLLRNMAENYHVTLKSNLLLCKIKRQKYHKDADCAAADIADV